jgi:hypothetical protein
VYKNLHQIITELSYCHHQPVRQTVAAVFCKHCLFPFDILLVEIDFLERDVEDSSDFLNQWRRVSSTTPPTPLVLIVVVNLSSLDSSLFNRRLVDAIFIRQQSSEKKKRVDAAPVDTILVPARC